MKALFVSLICALSIPASATNLVLPEALKSICQTSYIELGNGNYKAIHNVVAQEKNLTAVSHYSASPGTNFILFIDNLSGKALFSVSLDYARVDDLEFYGDELWALATEGKYKKSKLYRIRLDQNQKKLLDIQIFPTHNFTKEQEDYERAYGLSVDENYVYIAHGGLGVVKFSKAYEKPILDSNPDVNPNSKHESYATDVLVVDQKLFVGLDNITYSFGDKTRAFEGYAILNKEDLSLLKATPINQKREALFEPKLFLDQQKVVMSSIHLFFINSIQNLENSKTFVPQKRVYSYSKGKPLGLSYVKNNQILGCFKDDRNLPPESFAALEQL